MSDLWFRKIQNISNPEFQRRLGILPCHQNHQVRLIILTGQRFFYFNFETSAFFSLSSLIEIVHFLQWLNVEFCWPVSSKLVASSPIPSNPIQSRPIPQLSVFLHIGPGRLTTSSGLQQPYKFTKWNCKGLLLSLSKRTNGYYYGKMWDIMTNSSAIKFKIKISPGLENPLCYWRELIFLTPFCNAKPGFFTCKSKQTLLGYHQTKHNLKHRNISSTSPWGLLLIEKLNWRWPSNIQEANGAPVLRVDRKISFTSSPFSPSPPSTMPAEVTPCNLIRLHLGSHKILLSVIRFSNPPCCVSIRAWNLLVASPFTSKIG